MPFIKFMMAKVLNIFIVENCLLLLPGKVTPNNSSVISVIDKAEVYIAKWEIASFDYGL